MSFFQHPPEIIAAQGTGALGGMFYLLPPLPPIILVLVYHALIVFQALRLNHIASELRLYPKVAYVVGMTYILLTALFEQWAHITPALICNSLLIWLFGKMVRLQEVSLTRPVIYNIGMIAGLSVVLYHPAVTLVLLCLLALAILRPFHLNEWFIMLLGVVTPFYFLISVLFLSNSLEDIWLYIPEWSWHLPLPAHGLKTLLATAILWGVLLLVGIYLWRSHAKRTLIQVRKAWAVLLFMLLVLLPVMVICKDAGFESGIMAMVPAAAFIAGIFLFPRRTWLPALLFWLLTLLSLYNTWQH
ncbi:hypothetical protein [Filimonas lacunae]|uniref:hypothetical protein n=1 Tax=Filimonas lacunae TaxID=477680 RepID=UPI0007D72FB2|nr:hypothetical protein [Filimonas lacunae]BAV08823.1 hypothetical protein FLA_4870 [Filimonas lacunae]